MSYEYHDIAMKNLLDKQTVIFCGEDALDVIHKTIYQFFDVCGDDEEVPISDKDKLLLEVNKAICNNLKALEQEPKTGHWIYDGDQIICSKCHTAFGFISLKLVTNFCAECGADMRGEKE